MATAGISHRIPADVTIEGDLNVNGTLPNYPRSSLLQDDFVAFMIGWEAFRVWDAIGTNAPGTSASDDIGLYAGAFGTGVPYLATYDVKAAGSVSLYTRFGFMLPGSFVSGQSVRFRLSCGWKTTVADTSGSVDLECYKTGRNMLVSGTDLCTTAAIDIKTGAVAGTFTDRNFDITSTGLAAGDWLDVRLKLAVNDAASGTAVIAAIGAVEALLDIKG